MDTFDNSNSNSSSDGFQAKPKKFLPFSDWKAQQQSKGLWLSDADYQAKNPSKGIPAKPFSAR